MVDPVTDPMLFQSSSFGRRFILNPLKRLFDAIWHVLAYIVGVIIFGGILVNVLISLATTGSPGLADPTTWAISRPMLAHPTYSLAFLGVLACIGLSSYLVHRSFHATPLVISPQIIEEFGLDSVQRVIPTSSMIPFYRANVYIPRRVDGSGTDADALASDTLVAAATRPDPTRFSGQVGICVVGRKLLGTTRLAWEALKADTSFSSWILVRWPESPKQYVELWQGLHQHRAKVVIWLDDLSKYQDDRNSSLIVRLPYDLEKERIPFVIVATLPEVNGAEGIYTRFGGLLDHLIQIHPSDLTQSEANDLISKLPEAGGIVYRTDQFDGTPGSIVLAVDRMRDQAYPRLSDGAKDILIAMKLLRSVGIREYRLDRVLRTAALLKPTNHKDWTTDLEAVRSAGFVRQTVVDSGRLILLEPITEVYLDVAVPEFSDPAKARNAWPSLKESFVESQDAYALVRLGNAFRKSNAEQIPEKDQQAKECYQTALEYLTRATSSQDWANAQFGLGDVLSRQVDIADSSQQRKLLEETEEAFNNALLVVNRESDPTFWAEIQGRLADVIRHEATTTVGRRRRVNMLDDAEKSCREALRILRRDTMPEEWATAQQNLGLVLLTHAKFAQEANARRRMFDNALAALTASLTVFTPEYYVYRWARVQRAIGEASQLRADTSNRPKKDELLRQAVDAYASTLSTSTPIPVWQPGEQAEILSNLSICAYNLATLLGVASQEVLLVQAAEASYASAQAYSDQGRPDLAVQACQLLSNVELDRAEIVEGTARLAILDEVIQADIEALNHLGRQGAHELRPQMRLYLARLYWSRAANGDQDAVLVVQKDIEETGRYAEQALEYFTRDNAPTEYQQATKLQRDARNKAKTLGAVPTNVRLDNAPNN